ncbi:MAG: hypothetical protein MUE83_03450 [Tabrizicola sp.]|jgi:cell pole-organizing protein PopZ|nr:hypothetical protein [Tabrizicola sp.]
MAGPLSSEEIEDVVSSVRRLVSNEQRPRTLSRDLNSERLLLTPALRVVPETSPLAPLLLDAPLAVAAVEGGAKAASGPLDEALARDPGLELPAAPEPDLQDAESFLEALEPAVEADLHPGDADPPDVAPVVEALGADSAWEDELWIPPEPVPLGEVALAADEAAVLTAPPSDPEASDPEASDVDDTAAPWAEVPADWAEGGSVPFVPLRRRAEQFAARLASTGEPPDLQGPEPVQAVTASAEAATEAGPVVPTAETVVDSPRDGRIATELLDEDGTPLAVLDESALTEIVRQVLRAELQGELGERITRNVRKLVRAEINRALIARDLD